MSTTNTASLEHRRLLLPEMEGLTARWYDRQRGTAPQIAAWREQAATLTSDLPDGASILEVAPGPGYLAVELAKLGRFQVTGLDISRTMVEIARGHAAEAQVKVDFRLGDVTAMPFADDSFDLVICQAAFKNFKRPTDALNEMHRVLKVGGVALIQDLSRDASNADLEQEVSGQGLTGVGRIMTLWILGWLRQRAYSPARFQRLVEASEAVTGEVRASGVGLEVRITKAG